MGIPENDAEEAQAARDADEHLADDDRPSAAELADDTPPLDMHDIEEVGGHANLAQALLAVQAELPSVAKEGENPGFKRADGSSSKYMTLDAITAAVMPILNKHGLVWTTSPGFAEHEGRYEAVLNYALVHTDSAQERHGAMLLLSARDNPQGQGAAITYARRHALTAVLGITADEDDDGNRAADARQASQQRQQEARQGARILDEAQRAAMLTAVRESGLDVAETMERAGIDPDGEVTAAQSRQVRALIEAAKPVDGAS